MKKLVTCLLLSLLILTFVSCFEEEENEEIMITDWCDEDTMINVDFILYSSDYFNLYYLPGTAAERDREDILKKRDSALEVISRDLDIVETRVIDIYMTPSRRAANAHDVWPGSADLWRCCIQVLYLDEPHTYERSRYGHELTHVLAYNLDPDHRYHLSFIDEGLAEFFDQSGRNYHRNFVQECKAYKSDLETAIQLIQDDIFVYSYPKAASFIQNLFHIDPNPDKFKAFYKECYMYWDYNKPYAPDLEPLDGNKLIEIIDSLLVEHYSITLEKFNERWLNKLIPFLEAEPLQPSPDDINEIKHLFSVRDRAHSEGNASLYRSTMEGFYCDKRVDNERMDIAERMTSNPTPVQSTVIEVFDLGIKNYPIALVYFEKNINGKSESLKAMVEHYPVGWRFNWVEDELERTRLTSHSWITHFLFNNYYLFYDSNILYDPNILAELLEEKLNHLLIQRQSHHTSAHQDS